ncbi:hypothetical protein CYMTET_27000, partial [Cymbomonas tetramitiformis]
AYAFFHDRRLARAPDFDVVHFHDGHGVAYYSALAKHQGFAGSGLLHTRLMLQIEAPHLWLLTKGGGGGLHSVDDLEVNWMEQESARYM